jgi:hypothetical protein
VSLESLTTKVGRELNPLDFAEGLYQGVLGQPIKAVKQLCGATIEETDHTNDSLALKAGTMAGTAIDFAILSRLSDGLLNPALGKSADTILGSGAKMAITGGVYGTLLTPSSNDRSLLEGRLENGFVYASSLAVMGGGAKALEKNRFVGGNTLLAKSARNAIAGGLGGIPAAYSSVYFSEDRVAGIGEVAGYVGQNAAFGAAFGAADHGLGKVAKLPAVQEAYYKAKWDLDAKLTDARRTTYKTLDQVGMRHPLQRIGDLVHGTNDTITDDSSIRPKLTDENNPIARFERTLPQYVHDMETNEDQYANKGKATAGGDGGKKLDGYELYRQREQIQASFAHELLTIWHGTSETPGLKNHTDLELATPNTPPEQVAEIREVLNASARARVINRDSPFDDGMRKFIPGIDDLNAEYSSLLQGLGGGRESFYKYDEQELGNRMSMPRLHNYVDHAYTTPVDWSPIAADDPSPRYFHGTMSRALPSLFNERTLFSARELRLRGIGQATGESANEDFGRQNVSITRDFTEAWAYHRHSPAFLPDYPVVLGISGAAASHAWSAGMLEPGEILVKKLSLGESLWTRLGLKKPEITHIYVPDSEVPDVNNQLNARRISGVKVVGLSDLKPPQWNPEPTVEELRERYGVY